MREHEKPYFIVQGREKCNKKVACKLRLEGWTAKLTGFSDLRGNEPRRKKCSLWKVQRGKFGLNSVLWEINAVANVQRRLETIARWILALYSPGSLTHFGAGLLSTEPGENPEHCQMWPNPHTLQKRSAWRMRRNGEWRKCKWGSKILRKMGIY